MVHSVAGGSSCGWISISCAGFGIDRESFDEWPMFSTTPYPIRTARIDALTMTTAAFDMRGENAISTFLLPLELL